MGRQPLATSEQPASRPVLAITMGDPAGIGPELCLRVLADTSISKACVPVVFGDAGVLSRAAGCCRLAAPERIITRDDWRHVWKELGAPAVVDFAAVEAAAVEPGQVDAACGRAAYTYIEAAIAAALAREEGVALPGVPAAALRQMLRDQHAQVDWPMPEPLKAHLADEEAD